MPQKSSVDTHPKREEIAEQLRNGSESYRDMAIRYGVSKTAIARFKQKLYAEDIARSVHEDGDRMEVTPVEHDKPYGDFAINIYDDLVEMRHDLRAIRQHSMEEYPNIAINAIDKQVKLLDSYLKIVEEMRNQKKQDITNHPDFVAFRDAVAEVMRKYPGAIEELEEKLEDSGLL